MRFRPYENPESKGEVRAICPDFEDISRHRDYAFRSDTPHICHSLFLGASTLSQSICLRRPYGGPWNVANRCNCRIERIRQAHKCVCVENIRSAYIRAGLSVGDDMDGANRTLPIANSGARVDIDESPVAPPRLDYESPISPLTIKEVENTTSEWPKNFNGGMETSMGQKIVCSERCRFRNEEARKDSAEASDALWRTYRRRLSVR